LWVGRNARCRQSGTARSLDVRFRMMKSGIVVSLVFLAIQCSLGQSHDGSARERLSVAAAVAPQWPQGNLRVGRHEVYVVVTTDGYLGNVVDVEVKGTRSVFSQSSEAAARLWKFFPAESNSKETLTFVFEVFAKSDHTRRAMTTFIPPDKVLIEGPERSEGY
jgi:hypothetical protein